jgi:hypothetical protein
LSQESDEESYGNWEARIEVTKTSLEINEWCKIQ